VGFHTRLASSRCPRIIREIKQPPTLVVAGRPAVAGFTDILRP
jgi:hypothetical protein